MCKKEESKETKIMTNHSKAMQKLLKIIGIEDMMIVSFELKAGIDILPTISATFYVKSDEQALGEVITKEFELVAIGEN